MNYDNIIFSFVIPSWNIEYFYIRRLINSIPHLEKIQILLFEDGKNNLLSEEERFLLENDPWVEYIQIDEHLGLSAIRNLSLDFVKGEWVIYADSDDVYNTETLLEALGNISNQSIYDVVYWGTKTIFTDGRVFDDCYGYEQRNSIHKIQDKTFLLNHRLEVWRKTIRTAWLKQNNHIRNCSKSIFEDVRFSIQLLLSTDKIGIFPQLVYIYIRREKSSLSSSFPIHFLKQSADSLLKDVRQLSQKNMLMFDMGPKDMILRRIRKVSFFYYLYYVCKFSVVDISLFPRDFTQVTFSTQETNFYKALFNQIRVWGGSLKQKIWKE